MSTTRVTMHPMGQETGGKTWGQAVTQVSLTDLLASMVAPLIDRAIEPSKRSTR